MKTKKLRKLLAYIQHCDPKTFKQLPGPLPRVKKIRGRKRSRRKLDRLLNAQRRPLS